MANTVKEVQEEWDELAEDYKKLDALNEVYLKKIKEVQALQDNCKKHIIHQRYRMQKLSQSLKDVPEDPKTKELHEMFAEREASLQDIEQNLPRKSDRYMLKFILGRIDVSFLNKERKFQYKEDYEKFKLVCHFIAFVLCITLSHYNYRFLDKIFAGFLAWYYCTISIRESILKVNGSRIKGWWRVHHILSIVSSGLLLTWPDNEPWELFRVYFIRYTIYSTFTQYLQFRYQRGVLYRLKSLGEMENMDITVEGFHSWMWRGLTFLLPFLFIAYIFQLVNAVVLYGLSQHPQASWESGALAIIFLVFFVGNTITTLRVIPKKMKKNMYIQYKILSNKFYETISDSVRKESSKDSTKKESEVKQT
ncbi:transmembrane protein 120 homolog [Diabrotica virgifera virgifera]|uniref:Transmembrane protein 120 homolog n=1 Tax=Diabrotica virgifera virgifera TaxID=50390 RepID=A0A6P7FMA2_DIAVI|nr:transmembrane protein 120 homolog [Diabrotica virgifera virgifera]